MAFSLPLVFQDHSLHTVFICVLFARLCWEALLITLVKIYLDTHA